MGDKNEPLTGFSWRSGIERDTTGIVLWSDVFLTTNENGDKLAIILMDTQGLFGSSTSPVDNKRIFQLVTLLSSIQILNLYDVIQEDHLEYLNIATDFANNSNDKTFQKLLFLMRDWKLSDDFNELEGSAYINQVFKTKDGQPEALKVIRRNIRSSFDLISCLLLPFPGKSLTKMNYDGCWSVMDDDFKCALEYSIENLLEPKKLIVKQVYNQKVTAGELREYMKLCFKMFESNEDVKPESLYELSVAMPQSRSVDKSMDNYKNEFNCDDNNHLIAKKSATNVFDEADKIGAKKHHLSRKNMSERNSDEFSGMSKSDKQINVDSSTLKSKSLSRSSKEPLPVVDSTISSNKVDKPRELWSSFNIFEKKHKDPKRRNTNF